MKIKKSPLEIRVTGVGIAITVIAASMVALETGDSLLSSIVSNDLGRSFEIGIFLIIVALLVYGSLVYQFARFGEARRTVAHRHARQADLESLYDDLAAPLVMLIPSYREERAVVWQTLMSAALVEYPNRRIVLLIDDPPSDTSPNAIKNLTAMRLLPREIEKTLSKPAKKFRADQIDYFERAAERAVDVKAEAQKLSSHYRDAASWLERLATSQTVRDHTDRFFVERILLEPAKAHRERAQSLTEKAATETAPIDADDIRREYMRLSSLFSISISCFERKRYGNLSHEANKAMNLNSYMGLMGKHFREAIGPSGLRLDECRPEDAELHVPDAHYIITLDADSMLLSDYALRLVQVMEQPGNERIAIAQTPYSAFPNSNVQIERIAGATTDVQHIVHQGSTYFDAAYWVGANALIRKAALDEIAVDRGVDDHVVKIFIQDTTVIEDTAATIDLISRGWHIYNYPARLAYSATPPDFGSLLIQRRRWANGGLLILPHLLRYLTHWPWKLSRIREGLMRTNYLLSPLVVSMGVLTLLLYPFDDALVSVWLPLTAVPYYYLYGRDLVALGYDWVDLPRVYALNLLLTVVNFAGVAKSLQQAISGRKAPFGRTPKILDHTATPPMYLTAIGGLTFYCFVNSVVDGIAARYSHAFFLLVSGSVLLYAIHRFLGLRHCLEDAKIAADSFVARLRLVRGKRIFANHTEAKPATANIGPLASIDSRQEDRRKIAVLRQS